MHQNIVFLVNGYLREAVPPTLHGHCAGPPVFRETGHEEGMSKPIIDGIQYLSASLTSFFPHAFYCNVPDWIIIIMFVTLV